MNKSRAAAKAAKAQEAMADRIAAMEARLAGLDRKIDELLARLSPAEVEQDEKAASTSKKK